MRILVSVSAGKSSGVMAKLMKDNQEPGTELVFAIANTGKELEESLVFADRMDREWDLGLIWVEAVVHEGEKACTHKIVSFETASRNGEPFEAVIKKYGIPNMSYLHCTRELKANPLKSLMESLSDEPYIIAQGMRSDEPDRVSSKPNIIYPLAHKWPMRKCDVNDWWEDQPFNLPIMGYQGNCDACHKKHITKLVRIAQENPSVFDWYDRMETQYGLAGYNEDGNPRKFFRKHRSAKDILAIAELLKAPPLFADEDANDGCSEHCEAFD